MRECANAQIQNLRMRIAHRFSIFLDFFRIYWIFLDFFEIFWIFLEFFGNFPRLSGDDDQTIPKKSKKFPENSKTSEKNGSVDEENDNK